MTFNRVDFRNKSGRTFSNALPDNADVVITCPLTFIHMPTHLTFNNIYIPAGAETLYLSGAGASAAADGTWGNMEQQTVNIFEKFKATLEEQGWSMSDIVQVRIFGVAGADGEFDFEGINNGYLQFFGTEANPTKPVRTTVVVADLVNDNWLVEIEIRASRMPK